MKIVFTGDLFLGGDLLYRSQNNPINIPEYLSADLRVLNLESPISSNAETAEKPVLFAPTSAIENLTGLKADIVNLANNHIQDKGNEGIGETISVLESSGIKYFGAGLNLEGASQAIKLDEHIYLLGYCQYNSPTLNLIQRATESSPGVNPLDYEKVLRDLEHLPIGSKAILYLHWGREHVWMTQFKNVDLAKRLLEHDRVIHIIGMHPHRIQGVLKNGDKCCYFSLGNFLFPNFYIRPKHELFYPTEDEKNEINHYTYQYHSVFKPTYKKWKLVNRISLVLEFSSDDLSLKAIPVVQRKRVPEVVAISGLSSKLILLWFNLISVSYHFPKHIYVFLEGLHSWLTYRGWNMKVKRSKLRQLSVQEIISKLFEKWSHQ